MSTNKSSKWSSSSSLSKIVSRITRTLSFTSKKSQQTFKTNNKKVKPTETVVKVSLCRFLPKHFLFEFFQNVNFVPQSVPILRRHPPLPISKIVFSHHGPKERIHHENIYVNNYIEEEECDDDYYRYSLRPNLSLFNISVENVNCQSHEYPPLQQDWFDEIFHSTKIEEK